MTRIGVRDLKNQTSKIMREVREQQTEYVITHQGHPVAVLHPYGPTEAERERRQASLAAMAEMRQLAKEVSRAWSSSKSARALLDEQRR